MDNAVNKTDSWHSPVPVLSPGRGPIVNPNDSDFEDLRERPIATSASTTSNAHIPDQDVKGVTTSTSRIDVHENSASFRVDEFEFENDSNSDPAGSETGDTIESFEDVEDVQSASATVFDDFDITSECGSSSSFSDCGFVLSVQDEGLESDSDETDSEAEMSESNPETDTIVISDDTQRHDDPLVRTLSTLVDDKELPDHGGIDDFDDDEEDAVEVEEVYKALVMDENGAQDEWRLNRDEESPNVTTENSDSEPAESSAPVTFSSSQDARISALESAQSELTAELDEKNARISRLRSLLNETAAYRDKLEHDLALLQIQSTKQLADAREEAKQQKEEIEVRDERVKALEGELVEVREQLDEREKVDDERKAKIDALEGALQKKQVSVQELAASNGALQKELVEAKETTEKDMEQKEQQIREMDERINCLEDALSVAKESLEEKASTLDEAAKELLQTKSAFEREMDQVKDAFRVEMAEKDRGIITRDERICVLEAELSGTREALEVEKASALELLQLGEATKEVRNALEGELYNARETIAEKDREILMRDDRIQSLEVALLDMKEARGAAEANTAEATKGLEEENAQLKGRISYMEHDIAVRLSVTTLLSRQLDEARQEVDAQKAEVESKTRSVQQLEQELEDAKASLTMKNGEIARRMQSDMDIVQLRRRVSMAEKDVDRRKSVAEGYKASLRATENEVKVLKEEVRKTEESRKKWAAALEDLRKTRDAELQNAYQSSREREEALNRQLESKDKALAAMTARATTAEDRVARFKTKTSSHTSEVRNLEAKLTKKTQEAEQLRLKVTSVEGKLAKQTREFDKVKGELATSQGHCEWYRVEYQEMKGKIQRQEAQLTRNVGIPYYPHRR